MPIRDAYAHFDLETTVGVRPNPFSSKLEVDERWLKATTASILRWPGVRLSEEWVPSKAIIRSDENVWVSREELRPLDDVCTRFLSFNCFPTSQTRVNTILNLAHAYGTLARLSKLRNDFSLKGGVVQRLRLLEFCHDMPVDVRARLIDYLAKNKAIGMSDLDFEARYDPRANKYQYLLLMMAVLMWIKKKIVEEYSKDDAAALFDFSWTHHSCSAREQLRGKLQEAVEGLDAKHPLHGARIDSVVVGNHVHDPPKGYRTKFGMRAPKDRKDFFMFAGRPNGPKSIADAHMLFEGIGATGIPRTSCENVYASCVTYIGEASERARPEHLRSVFHLLRIKHSFVLYYTTARGECRCDRLAGELVDLSIPDAQDETVAFLRSRMPKSLAALEHLPIVGVPDAMIPAHSVPYTYAELQVVLHRAEQHPSRVSKMEKRLVRYVAFMIATLFSPFVRGDFEGKVRGLIAATDATASAASLADATRRTGIDFLDEFLARERDSQASGAYLRRLHAHVHNFARVFVLDTTTWNATTVRRFFLWHDELFFGSELDGSSATATKRELLPRVTNAMLQSFDGADAFISCFARMDEFMDVVRQQIGGQCAYATGAFINTVWMSIVENLRSPVRHSLVKNVFKHRYLTPQDYIAQPGIMRFYVHGVSRAAGEWRTLVFEKLRACFDPLLEFVSWFNTQYFVRELRREGVRVCDVSFGRESCKDDFDGHATPSEHPILCRTYALRRITETHTDHHFSIHTRTHFSLCGKKGSRHTVDTDLLHIVVPVHLERTPPRLSVRRYQLYGSVGITSLAPHSWAARQLQRGKTEQAACFYALHLLEAAAGSAPKLKAAYRALARDGWASDPVLERINAEGRGADLDVFLHIVDLHCRAFYASVRISIDGMYIDFISPQSIEDTFY